MGHLLRPETPGDRIVVGQLHRAAFGDEGAWWPAWPMTDAPRQLVPVQTLSPLAVLPERQRRGSGAAWCGPGCR